MKNKIDEVKVMYANSLAFTSCTCGNELVLSQNIYGKSGYNGSCKCGKCYKLLNGELHEVLNEKQN